MARNTRGVRLFAAGALTVVLGMAPPGASQVRPGPPGPVMLVPGGPKLVLPDLKIGNIKLKKSICQESSAWYAFDVTVVNAGGAPATETSPGMWSWLRLTADGGAFTTSFTPHNLTSIPAQTSVTFGGELIKVAVKPPFKVKAVVDPGKMVVEQSETNNEASITVTTSPCQPRR
jgi:hypothetical protein